MTNRRKLTTEPEPTEDFPEITEEMLAGAVRGRFADALDRRSNAVLIDEDLRGAFPTEHAVNDALRTMLGSLENPQPIGRPVPDGVSFTLENRRISHDYDRPFRTVVIHNDLHPFFPNAAAVNRALRAAAELIHQVEARRTA
jgi:hypothetical protein